MEILAFNSFAEVNHHLVKSGRDVTALVVGFRLSFKPCQDFSQLGAVMTQSIFVFVHRLKHLQSELQRLRAVKLGYFVRAHHISVLSV